MTEGGRLELLNPFSPGPCEKNCKEQPRQEKSAPGQSRGEKKGERGVHAGCKGHLWLYPGLLE